jgi:hypothetical protein
MATNALASASRLPGFFGRVSSLIRDRVRYHYFTRREKADLNADDCAIEQEMSALEPRTVFKSFQRVGWGETH